MLPRRRENRRPPSGARRGWRRHRTLGPPARS